MTGGRGGLSASGLVLLHVMYFIWAFGLWLRSAFAFAFWEHAATLGAGHANWHAAAPPPPGGGSGKPSISHVNRMVVTVCPVTAERPRPVGERRWGLLLRHDPLRPSLSIRLRLALVPFDSRGLGEVTSEYCSVKCGM